MLPEKQTINSINQVFTRKNTISSARTSEYESKLAQTLNPEALKKVKEIQNEINQDQTIDEKLRNQLKKQLYESALRNESNKI